jgi:phosphoserine phosphatase
MSKDPINPNYYASKIPNVECIDVTEHMGFCLGNVIKYVWRAGAKGEALEDLKKARWYLDREIARLESTINYSNGCPPQVPPPGAKNSIEPRSQRWHPTSVFVGDSRSMISICEACGNYWRCHSYPNRYCLADAPKFQR